MKERKLIFSEEIKQRERKRVRNFKITTIVIGLILCVLVIPLLELKSYKNNRNESQKYISIAEHIWYKGIEDIKYNELSIKVVDDDMEYENINKEGICNIYNKVQVMICMQDIEIIQNLNTITIQKGLSKSKILTLEFIPNENKEVIKTHKTTYVVIEIFSIIFCYFIGYIAITSYEIAEYRRMVIDMNNKHS